MRPGGDGRFAGGVFEERRFAEPRTRMQQRQHPARSTHVDESIDEYEKLGSGRTLGTQHLSWHDVECETQPVDPF
jgi:hypothetical protein